MVKQVNLLPESKQIRVQAARTRKLAIAVSSIIIAIAVGVPLLILTIKGSQLLLLNRTQSKIDEHKTTLKNTENIATMLTVKDHLASLPALYDQRLKATGLLNSLPPLTPSDVRLSSLEINTAGTMTITGTAPSYASVENFYLALLLADSGAKGDRVEPDPQTTGLFTGVEVKSVSGASGGDVSFTINANFSPQLTIGEGNG